MFHEQVEMKHPNIKKKLHNEYKINTQFDSLEIMPFVMLIVTAISEKKKRERERNEQCLPNK